MQASPPKTVFDFAVEKVQEIIQALSNRLSTLPDTVCSLSGVMRSFQGQIGVAGPSVDGVSVAIIDELRMSRNDVGSLERDVRYAMTCLMHMHWDNAELDALAQLLCKKYEVPATHTSEW